MNTNDTDAEDGTPPGGAISITGTATGLSVMDNGDQTFTFSHDGSEELSSSFTYSIQDSEGATSNTATASLTVNPINDPPIANQDFATVQINVAGLVNVLANDTDADDGIDPTTVVIVTPATIGSTSVDAASGVVTYTPNMDVTGNDSFGYTVMDVTGATSNEATVNLVISDSSFAICAIRGNRAVVNLPLIIDSSVVFTLPVNSYTATGLPASLTLGLLNGVITGTPAVGDDLASPYDVEILADDGAGGQSFQFRLTIDADNDTIFYSSLESTCILPPNP